VTAAPRVFRGLGLPRGSTEAMGERGGEIQVRGLEHGGGPYEVHIFLNNPGANADTERSEQSGYAGTIHVYGAGDPPGAPPRRVDRALDITPALRRAGSEGGETTVTLVPVADPDGGADRPLEDIDVSLRVH
jgi:hypothetical protein